MNDLNIVHLVFCAAIVLLGGGLVIAGEAGKEFFSERKIMHGALCLILIILSFMLVFMNVQNVGLAGLVKMIVGVGGLLSLLAHYNGYYR